MKEKHKHEWVEEYIDCPFCGGGIVETCDCGEEREKPIKSYTNKTVPRRKHITKK